MSEPNPETEEKASTCWAVLGIVLGVAAVVLMIAQPWPGVIAVLPLAIFYGLYMNDPSKTAANRQVAEGAFTCMAMGLVFEPVWRAEPAIMALIAVVLVVILLFRRHLLAWREMASLAGIGLAVCVFNVSERIDSQNPENRQLFSGCVNEVYHQSRVPASFSFTDQDGNHLRIWHSKFESKTSAPAKNGACGEVLIYKSGSNLKLLGFETKDSVQPGSPAA